jgi:hypothetical protein
MSNGVAHHIVPLELIVRSAGMATALLQLVMPTYVYLLLHWCCSLPPVGVAEGVFMLGRCLEEKVYHYHGIAY